MQTVWWLLFSSADDKMDGAIAVLTGCVFCRVYSIKKIGRLIWFWLDVAGLNTDTVFFGWYVHYQQTKNFESICWRWQLPLIHIVSSNWDQSALRMGHGPWLQSWEVFLDPEFAVTCSVFICRGKKKKYIHFYIFFTFFIFTKFLHFYKSLVIPGVCQIGVLKTTVMETWCYTVWRKLRRLNFEYFFFKLWQRLISTVV